MEYFVRGEIIDIPDDKKPFGKGSEGRLYKIKDELYKIYYPNMINEGYGSKHSFHQYLIGLPTKQIVLPEDLIFDTDGNYAGYTTKVVKGNQVNKQGITLMDSKSFITNLKVLEEDFDVLSNNYVLAADVTQFNYMFDTQANVMNIIDPGRYRYKDISKDRIKMQNDLQLDTLINLLLYSDFIKYKPIGSKRKSQLLKDLIKELKGDLRYSEFFEKEIGNNENVDSYVKSLGKYIR